MMIYDLNCHECTDQQKEHNGCMSEGTTYWQMDGKESKRCPLSVVTLQTWLYIKAYNFLEKGYLPNGKGWMDESQKFFDAMNIIGGTIAEIKRNKEGN